MRAKKIVCLTLEAVQPLDNQMSTHESTVLLSSSVNEHHRLNDNHLIKLELISFNFFIVVLTTRQLLI
jgi:hypothetical protein